MWPQTHTRHDFLAIPADVGENDDQDDYDDDDNDDGNVRQLRQRVIIMHVNAVESHPQLLSQCRHNVFG